ncbi:MAG: 2-polyprenyl-3-methyl-6-methoxy-1,4-benzoquinone monooxygenase [Gammaproteobacteria bacterium]|nr:2-polyprenyl-3-methyl-6-methoxy-1,4-benzoquinone monooxygenase [Gammaproteobacteria bacterium]NCF80059.1 2-polyprenyl-3-methyl-6-methoxy-1,4-benzoquinone monooxygenase [Pseudomonadota bacterium]
MYKHSTRRMSLLDRVIIDLDRGLRGLGGASGAQGRENPAGELSEAELTPAQRRHAAGLMRVDHTGEVAAQALYHGQALTARTPRLREAMEQAAREEGDHLRWCSQRLEELDDQPSRLGPLWYVGSFLIGAAAGLTGDRWSLGFVVETERQVVRHLDGHLSSLPPGDARSRAVLEQMRVDEGVHATTAIESGAAELPQPVKRLMKATARIMTETAYRI